MAAGNGRRYCRRVFLPPNAPPTRRARLVLAWCVALVSATFVAFRFAGRPADTGDFDLAYTSARMLRAGLDPYLRIGPHAPVADAVGSRYLFPMAYPLPAVLIALPFSLLPLVAARAAFGALGGGLLAYALAARGRGAGLAVFLSAPYLHALGAVQWSPLLTAAALLPGVGFLLAAKPTTGAALFGARPTRATVLGGLAVAALSLAALPAWPLEWWHAARAHSPARPGHGAPCGPARPARAPALAPARGTAGRAPRVRPADARAVRPGATVPRPANARGRAGARSPDRADDLRRDVARAA